MILNYSKFLAKKDSEWVVFLHGIGDGSSIWIKQIKEFNKHFHLLLIDLPGHGNSSYGLADMKERSFSRIAEEVLKVMNHENISKAHFAGISLGTIVIQSLHDMASDRVTSMILGGAVEKFNRPARVMIQVANVIKHCIPYMWLYKICALILLPREHHKEARMAFIKEAYKLGRREFLHWYGMHTQVDITIKHIKGKESTTPKLYIMGSEDYMFLPHIKTSLNQTKNEILHVIDKCGHVCNIEAYKEFNQLALDFLIPVKNEIKMA